MITETHLKTNSHTLSLPTTSDDALLELSIVMPCLDEAETLAVCIGKAQRSLSENSIAGEVIIADNGSTDGSQGIAERLGARVVPVAEKGYGSALMGGIAAAHGKYVIMGDADSVEDLRSDGDGETDRVNHNWGRGFACS